MGCKLLGCAGGGTAARVPQHGVHRGRARHPGERSGQIGNRADKSLLALRTAVDAVLVGAGTARTERYRKLVKAESQRRLRLERGLAEEPLACIVSAGLALSPESVPLLGSPPRGS